MPTLTPLDPIPQEQSPSTELAEFKATLEKAIEKNASVIENTHFTLRGIAQLLDISKDLWEFYRHHAQGVKLTSEQLESLKREINTLSTHINQTLETLNDQKTKATELLQETTTKLQKAAELAAQSQADMQAARQALETIKALETKLPEIQTQLESINSAISNAIDKKQELEDRASELKIEISTALTQKKSQLETQLTEKKTQLESELESQLESKKTELESTLTQASTQAQEALETKKGEIETALETIKADTQAIKTQTQELATQTASKAQQLESKASELATKQEQIEQAQRRSQEQLESVTQATQAAQEQLAEAKEQATRGIESYKAGFINDISIEFAKMMEHFTPTSAIALSALSARVGLLEQSVFQTEILSHITSHFYTIQDMFYHARPCEELPIPEACHRAYIVAYGGAEQQQMTRDKKFLQDTGVANLVVVGGFWQGESIQALPGELKAQQRVFQGERNLEINVDAVGGFVLVLFFTNRVPSQSDDPFFSIHTDQFGLEASGLSAYLAHLESLDGGETLQGQALDQLTQATILATEQSLTRFKEADFTSLKSFYTARLEYENTRKQIARQNGLQVPAPIDTQPYLDNAIDRGMLAYYIYLHNRRSDNELITRTFPLVLERIAEMMDTHTASDAIAYTFSAEDLERLSGYFDSLGPLYRGGFTTEQERRTNLGFYLTYMAYAQGESPRDPRDQMSWCLSEIYRHLGRPNLADTLKYTQMTKIINQEIPSEKSVANLKAYIKATIDSDVQDQAEQKASACVRGLQDTHAQGIFSVLHMIKNAMIMGIVDSGELPPPPPKPLDQGGGNTMFDPSVLENDGNVAFLTD